MNRSLAGEQWSEESQEELASLKNVLNRGSLAIVAGGKMTATAHRALFSDEEWALLQEDLGLSPRQAEIVSRLLQGMSDKQIAWELDISLPTVRTHMGRLFRKFDLNDRIELILHVFARLREYWCKGDGPLSLADTWRESCHLGGQHHERAPAQRVGAEQASYLQH